MHSIPSFISVTAVKVLMVSFLFLPCRILSSAALVIELVKNPTFSSTEFWSFGVTIIVPALNNLESSVELTRN